MPKINELNKVFFANQFILSIYMFIKSINVFKGKPSKGAKKMIFINFVFTLNDKLINEIFANQSILIIFLTRPQPFSMKAINKMPYHLLWLMIFFNIPNKGSNW